MSVAQILEELPTLTATEQKEILNRARALIQAEAEAEAIAISEVCMQDGIEAENEARRTR